MARPTPQDLVAFAGRQPEADVMAAAEQVLSIVEAFARAYTRGRGFLNGMPGEDVEAVIMTASARLLLSPEQWVRDEAGEVSTVATPFVSWTLVEGFVLNRYRKRAA